MAPELTCKELVELVTDYFEGRLLRAEHERFEEHLAACPPCRTYLEQMRQTISLVGELRVADVSPEAEAALVSAFRSLRPAH